MNNKNIFTRILAVAGTVLAWLPILAPVLLGMAAFVMDGRFRLDYLMPAELFLVALSGGLLLLWAALRLRSKRVLVITALGIAVISLLVSQGIAVLTGLASGSIEPSGWPLYLVLAFLVVYILALILMGVAGILICGVLFDTRR